jgi:hypothetical protein
MRIDGRLEGGDFRKPPPFDTRHSQPSSKQPESKTNQQLAEPGAEVVCKFASVSGTPRFTVVFGRSWTEVGLEFTIEADEQACHSRV